MFVTYLKPEDYADIISNTNIRSIFAENSEIIWLGTRGSGLIRFDRTQKSIVPFRYNPNNPNTLSHDHVYGILKGDSRELWIGTYGGGLNKFDPEKRKFTRYLHDPENPNSLSDNIIQCLYKDHNGSLWIGTNNGGLNRLDPKTGNFKHYRHDPSNPNSLRSDNIRTVMQGKEGYYWIGTQGGGLSRLDPKTQNFKHFLSSENGLNSLSQNFVLCLYDDGKGRLWVGTGGAGLDRLDKKTETFTSFSTENGLPNNVVYAVMEDKSGNLWISTNKGISRFDPDSNIFNNYDVSDGIQSNEFNYGAFFKRPDGEMFFGGINGFTAFYPENIEDNPYIPPVVITKLQIYNQNILPGEKYNSRTIISKSIEQTEQIQLKYDENFLTFEFAALNFENSDKNQYEYFMQGLDKEWNRAGNRKHATYSHLPPGRFVFHVRGSNNDGLWNKQGASIKVAISPPFWRTIWFQGLLIISVFSAIVLVFLARTRYIRRQSRILQKKVEEHTSELKKANTELIQEIKDRKKAEKNLKDREEKLESSLAEKEVLLKEIHHRVKNNMQVISSLLRLQAFQIKDKNLLNMFSESQNRIQSMSLIHEILYQSKDLSQIKFSKYVKNLTKILMSSYGIQENRIHLIQDIKEVYLNIQQAIPCGLIINELVSNALKHAFPDDGGGEILVRMHQDRDGLYVLIIRDTGKGFPENIDFRKTKSLGMQLVNGLISQVQGTIELKRDNGTTWVIKFP